MTTVPDNDDENKPPVAVSEKYAGVLAPNSDKKYKRLLILVVVLVLIIVGSVGAAVYAWFFRAPSRVVKAPSPLVSVLPSISPEITPDETLNSSLEDPTPKPVVSPVLTQPKNEKGVTWFNPPEKFSKDLKLVQPSNENKDSSYGGPVTYYRLGTDQDKDVVLAVVPFNGPGSEGHLIFVQTDTGYDLLAKQSDENFFSKGQYDNNIGPALGSSVKVNLKKFYPSISPPDSLVVKGASLTLIADMEPFAYVYQDNTDNDFVLFDTTPYGQLMTNETSVPDQPIESQRLILKLYDGEVKTYEYLPAFITDNNVPQVTWSDGSTNKDEYEWSSSGGCGTPGIANILNSKYAPDLRVSGKTSSGEAVYGFANLNNPALVKEYQDNLSPEGKYSQYDPKTGLYTDIPMTIQAYVQKHGVFFYKDPLGRYIEFLNRKYGPQVECGKPVIYLYPEKTTDVSVKVGANITKSEPDYGKGWQVTASPDGKLLSGGKVYDSLFWEGTGNGIYPQIKSGFIVEQKDLENTLRDHLARLGLNAKESADFLAFWLPKMPTTPYVCLTWFGTQDMNQLAPLTIKPLPKTVIRIFLDFQGLQKPYIIEPQKLSSPAREGFTVVEWGGLLIKSQGAN